MKDSTHLTVLRKYILYTFTRHIYFLNCFAFYLHCLTNKLLIAFGAVVKRGRNLVCADGEPPNTYIKVSLSPWRHCLLELNIRLTRDYYYTGLLSTRQRNLPQDPSAAQFYQPSFRRIFFRATLRGRPGQENIDIRLAPRQI